LFRGLNDPENFQKSLFSLFSLPPSRPPHGIDDGVEILHFSELGPSVLADDFRPFTPLPRPPDKALASTKFVSSFFVGNAPPPPTTDDDPIIFGAPKCGPFSPFG